jgi:hypothetical protein
LYSYPALGCDLVCRLIVVSAGDVAVHGIGYAGGYAIRDASWDKNMNDIVNGIMNAIVGMGEVIDTLKAIIHTFADLADAVTAILRLIGRLAGG